MEIKPKTNINIFAILIGITAGMTSFVVTSNAFAQELIPTPIKNITDENSSQTEYPVVESYLNGTTWDDVKNPVSGNNTIGPVTNNIQKPDTQIIVLAEDLFEIRDNLAEARQALNQNNFLELAQSIDNIDQLVTVLINPLPTNATAFEQNNQLPLQESQMKNK